MKIEQDERAVVSHKRESKFQVGKIEIRKIDWEFVFDAKKIDKKTKLAWKYKKRRKKIENVGKTNEKRIAK